MQKRVRITDKDNGHLCEGGPDRLYFSREIRRTEGRPQPIRPPQTVLRTAGPPAPPSTGQVLFARKLPGCSCDARLFTRCILGRGAQGRFGLFLSLHVYCTRSVVIASSSKSNSECLSWQSDGIREQERESFWNLILVFRKKKQIPCEVFNFFFFYLFSVDTQELSEMFVGLMTTIICELSMYKSNREANFPSHIAVPVEGSQFI